MVEEILRDMDRYKGFRSVALRYFNAAGADPEGRIGEVKAGQAARVYLDSKPDAPIDAVVTRIDPEATFTPENTYFRDDRVKQVVGVKVQLKGAVGFAKPGMPADGEILASGAWPSGRERVARRSRARSWMAAS